jgi:hypothetical protein
VVAREDIEQFLDRLAVDGATWHEVEAGFWVVKPGGALDLDVVVNYAPPVLVLRVKVMDLPSDAGVLSRLFRQLLEWNANDLLHGSYGIQDKAIVLTAALELAHLDYEELRASYESMTLALAKNLRELSAYREVR